MPDLAYIDMPEVSCGTCRFGMNNTDGKTTICRLSPPAIVYDKQGTLMTQWPLTHNRQVCAQHQPGERRILLDEMEALTSLSGMS